jgi:nitroreductase
VKSEMTWQHIDPIRNPVVEAVLARHSTRHGYLDQPVENRLVETVLRCGLAAPSSKNAQPWRLHVVTSAPTLAALARAMTGSADVAAYVPHDPRTGEPHPQYVSTVNESADVLRRAPVAIFVENLGAFSHGRTALAAASRPALAGALVGYGFELVGIGAAIENMWIAATALGLGAAFMGDVAIAETAVRDRLRLEGDLVGVLVIGHIEQSTPRFPPADNPAEDVRVRWHQD